MSSKIQEVSGLGTPIARLSAIAMKFVLEQMLMPLEEKRLNAEQLQQRFGRMLENSQPLSPPISASFSPSITVFGQDQLPWRSRDSRNSSIDHDRIDMSDVKGKIMASHRHSQEPRELSRQTNGFDAHPENHYSPGRDEGSRTNLLPTTSLPKEPIPSTSEGNRRNPSSRSSNESSRPKIIHRHSNYPMCTVPQVIKWIPNSKRYKEKLEGMEAALSDLNNRDQVGKYLHAVLNTSWLTRSRSL
jgi:hypothetical protein